MGSYSPSQIELFVEFRVGKCSILRQVLSWSEIIYPNTFESGEFENEISRVLNRVTELLLVMFP